MKSIFPRHGQMASRGFSLIEILIALTLLAVAGTFVAGKFFEQLTEGQQKSAKIQMQNVAERLKDFRRRCGFYPTTDQTLEALISKPTSGRECKNYPPSGFLDSPSIPKDPWDYDFEFTSDGKAFNLRSFGADGVEGGEGGDSDITLNDGKVGTAGSSPAPQAPEPEAEAAPEAEAPSDGQ